MGNVGAGKSTLLDGLKPNYAVTQEGVGSWNFFNLFLMDSKRYAFTFQVEVMLSLHMTALANSEIYERSIVESIHVFAQYATMTGYLQPAELDLLLKVADTMAWLPDRVVYIKTAPAEVLTRIAQRNRQGEVLKYDLAYISGLDSLYEALILALTKVPGVTVFTVYNNGTPADLVAKVVSALECPL
jgi:deoxyadenosine/deoxycytidine kinase